MPIDKKKKSEQPEKGPQKKDHLNQYGDTNEDQPKRSVPKEDKENK